MTVSFVVKNVLYSDAPAVEFVEPLPEHGAVAVGDDIALLLTSELAFEQLDRVSCRYQGGLAIDEPDLARAEELIVKVAGLRSTFEIHAGSSFGVFIVCSDDGSGDDPDAIERLVSALRSLGMDDLTVRTTLGRRRASEFSQSMEPEPARASGSPSKFERTLARCAIGDFPGGHGGRIVGVLDMVGEPLEAPISRRPCAAYVVTVDEYLALGAWQTVLHVIRSLDYLAIRDQTGSALVELERAQVHIVADAHLRTGFLRPSNKRVAKFLFNYGQALDITGPPRRLRVKEGVLEPGETVAAIGVGVWEASAQSALQNFRDNARRLAFRHRDDHQLLVTDEPSLTAGRVEAREIPMSLLAQLTT